MYLQAGSAGYRRAPDGTSYRAGGDGGDGGDAGGRGRGAARLFMPPPPQQPPPNAYWPAAGGGSYAPYAPYASYKDAAGLDAGVRRRGATTRVRGAGPLAAEREAKGGEEAAETEGSGGGAGCTWTWGRLAVVAVAVVLATAVAAAFAAVAILRDAHHDSLLAAHEQQLAQLAALAKSAPTPSAAPSTNICADDLGASNAQLRAQSPTSHHALTDARSCAAPPPGGTPPPPPASHRVTKHVTRKTERTSKAHAKDDKGEEIKRVIKDVVRTATDCHGPLAHTLLGGIARKVVGTSTESVELGVAAVAVGAVVAGEAIHHYFGKDHSDKTQAESYNIGREVDSPCAESVCKDYHEACVVGTLSQAQAQSRAAGRAAAGGDTAGVQCPAPQSPYDAAGVYAPFENAASDDCAYCIMQESKSGTEAEKCVPKKDVDSTSGTADCKKSTAVQGLLVDAAWCSRMTDAIGTASTDGAMSTKLAAYYMTTSVPDYVLLTVDKLCVQSRNGGGGGGGSPATADCACSNGGGYYVPARDINVGAHTLAQASSWLSSQREPPTLTTDGDGATAAASTPFAKCVADLQGMRGIAAAAHFVFASPECAAVDAKNACMLNVRWTYDVGHGKKLNLPMCTDFYNADNAGDKTYYQVYPNKKARERLGLFDHKQCYCPHDIGASTPMNSATKSGHKNGQTGVIPAVMHAEAKGLSALRKVPLVGSLLAGAAAAAVGTLDAKAADVIKGKVDALGGKVDQAVSKLTHGKVKLDLTNAGSRLVGGPDGKGGCRQGSDVALKPTDEAGKLEAGLYAKYCASVKSQPVDASGQCGDGLVAHTTTLEPAENGLRNVADGSCTTVEQYSAGATPGDQCVEIHHPSWSTTTYEATAPCDAPGDGEDDEPLARKTSCPSSDACKAALGATPAASG